MIVELDCGLMTDRKQAHEYLKEIFEFPDFYGRNLDALYDLLSAFDRSCRICLVNTHLIEENLGGYGSALLSAIREAAQDNPAITVIEETNSGT